MPDEVEGHISEPTPTSFASSGSSRHGRDLAIPGRRPSPHATSASPLSASRQEKIFCLPAYRVGAVRKLYVVPALFCLPLMQGGDALPISVDDALTFTAQIPFIPSMPILLIDGRLMAGYAGSACLSAFDYHSA